MAHMSTREQRIRNWANSLHLRVMGPKGGPFTLIEQHNKNSIGDYVTISELESAVGQYGIQMRLERQHMTDEELIETWFGELTKMELAKTYGVTESWLTSGWKRLRALGKLPSNSRPRNSAKKTTVRRAAENRLDVDGRPATSTSLFEEDRLLDKLWKEHPEKMEKKDD